MMMKKLAVLLGTALTLTGVQAETLIDSWTAEGITVSDGKGCWYIKRSGKHGKFLGMGGENRGAGLDRVKRSFRDGRFVVDTRACDFSQPRSFISVSFVLPVAELPVGPELEMACEIGGTPGARGLIGHNGGYYPESAPKGQYGKPASTHYWNNAPFMLEESAPRPVSYVRAIPKGLKGLHLQLRLQSQGVFEIGKVSWKVAEKKAVAFDPAENQIPNGGAERGWYGIAMAPTITYNENGAYQGQDGHWFTTSIVPAIDTDEKRSGRASFRLSVDHDRAKIPGWGPYNMEFPQVPVVKGQPICFSAWLKSAKPGMRIWLRLSVGNGGTGSYIKDCRLTTEWKRYELVVPSAGLKDCNGSSYGDLGCHAGYASPRLDLVSPGTVWMDDAGVFLAKTGDYTAERTCLSGRLDKKSRIYYAGEKVAVNLTLENGAGVADGRTVTLTSKALDWRGEVVATTAPRTVELGEGAANVTETLALPAAFRGPVQWLFEADGVKAGFSFGVIDARKPPLLRFGYNLCGNVNLPRAIELMRDFRIGTVRVWDSKLATAANVDRLHKLHDAGIDVLYCFANAGVLPTSLRYLVVKDPAEWQAHIADVVTNCMGCVGTYEILNEPNARSGMGRNPDPAKYDLLTTETNAEVIRWAYEAIRKYDKTTPIGGPTTCHTDLSWTLDVLGRGAAKYLDVITEHPYCALPEVPDYAKQVRTLLAEGARMKGSPIRSYATERGKPTPSNPRHGEILAHDVAGAGTIVRTMIVGYAGGSSRFYDFQLGTHNYAHSYIQAHNGNPDNDFLARPTALLYAQRALMDLIEDAPVVRALDIGIASRAYVFDRGDRRIVAFWKFQGEPRKVVFPAAGVFYDFMGVSRRLTEVTVDKFPQYLETRLSAESVEKLFASLDFGPKASDVAEEAREQTKVPYFEKEVDWTKAAVLKAETAVDAPKPGDAAEVRLAWNRSGLKMRVAVKKEGFHPDATSFVTLWKGDSLQVGFDTIKNAAAATQGYDDEDFEYDLASYKGKPVVYRRHASLPYHDSLHKPLGLVEDVQVQIDVKPGETVYTINFAPQAVSPFRLGKGESMRLSVGANLSDGTKRYGALALTPGLMTAKKHPYDFLEIVLGE